MRLHNYPKFLQNLVQDNGERFDLGTIDILRDRERGVPRYNRFRRLLHKPPVRSFEELTDSPEWAAEIKRVYNNDLEMVDTMVGLMAEPLPEGMGFSDTAFRIFLLMASRRLKSDRFLSQDYRPEIYTKEGIDWVEENSMKSVISRHFPSVAFAMEGLEDDNAFKPWKVKKALKKEKGEGRSEKGETSSFCLLPSPLSSFSDSSINQPLRLGDERRRGGDAPLKLSA